MATTTASGQTTTWEGHTYEVIHYKDVTGEEPTVAFQWWSHLSPYEHAASLGGHLLTITSAEEEEAIRAMWANLTGSDPEWSFFTILDRVTVDRTSETWVAHWATGEVSTYIPSGLPEADYDYFILMEQPMRFTYGSNQILRDGSAFYILEIDPPIGPVDTDGDGLTDDQEKNTRHSYSFVQAPTPVDPVKKTGGFSKQECIADAIARGGHLLDVVSQAEMHEEVQSLSPWLIGVASNFLNVTPILHPIPNVGGCIRTGERPPETAYINFDCQDHSTFRFATYILEIEDSTDPNNPDTDADGLTDGQEVLTYLTDPLNADSDGDQLFDGIEINTTKTNPLVADTDGDGLDDYVEVATHKTNPLLADTDGDGFDDKLEVDKGTNPLDPASLPVVALTVYPAIEIEFPTKAGESYQLQVSADLQTWAPFGDVFVGTGQPYARFIAAREQASFLRAVIVN